MVFAWVFSIASLIALFFAKIFFVLAPGFEMLYLSLSLIALCPWMFPVISHIRRDAVSPHSPLTVAGIVSLIIISLLLLITYLSGVSL
jgi:hypothetical protein